jgi:hypothetical protein
MTVRQFAEQIARDLFTNGLGQRADRLLLVRDVDPPSSLGGWSEEAMADRIEEALSKALPLDEEEEP